MEWEKWDTAAAVLNTNHSLWKTKTDIFELQWAMIIDQLNLLLNILEGDWYMHMRSKKKTIFCSSGGNFEKFCAID